MSKRRLKYEGVPEGDMTMVANVIGAEATRRLMHELAGIKIYIPKSKEYRLWYVQQFFEGDNQRDLSRELGVSERLIQMDVVEIQRKRRAEREEGRQGSLFAGL